MLICQLQSIATAEPTAFDGVDVGLLRQAADRLAQASSPPVEPETIETARVMLHGIISSNEVVVFSALVGANGDKVCPYCKEAMEAMAAAGITFHHQMVGAKGTNSRTALTEMTGGVAKVPMAFVFNTWIGGYDETDTDGLEAKPPGNGIMPNLKSGKLKEAYDKKDIAVLPATEAPCMT